MPNVVLDVALAFAAQCSFGGNRSLVSHPALHRCCNSGRRDFGFECEDLIELIESVAIEYSREGSVTVSPTMQGLVEEPKVVVGLDFGTSFSGFAFALRASPEKIYLFYDWPKHSEGGGLPYCKTQTSLLYASSVSEETGEQTLELLEWGWPAFIQYKSSVVAETGDPVDVDYASPDLDFEVVHNFEIEASTPKMPTPAEPGHSGASSAGFHFLSNFKLHLASNDAATTAPALPQGLNAKRAIADFLSRIAKFVLQEVRNKFGPHISLDDVQWCLTVPALWDVKANQEMQDCAEMAGLVQGPSCNGDIGSPHRLKFFFEPEAASVYVQGFTESPFLRKGSKFLVVDCGGGTVDLVLHEKLGDAPTLSVKEVQESSGDICGGSLVDDEFFKFLRRKISCFKRFEIKHPAIVLAFLKAWEKIKYRFDGENEDENVELPPTLAEMWETEGGTSSASYDELILTNGDMKSMFDPIVNRVLELIEEKMVPDLTAMMVVGGFSESPYLKKRIKDTFGSRVSSIESPPNPGSAVCQGAVTLGIQSDIVVSRISKKTYGLRVSRPFIAGVHDEYFKVEGSAGKFYCNNIFAVFVRKGDEVRFDDCVQNVYFPMCEKQDELEIVLYSSSSRNVKFISDVGAEKEGTFTIKIPTQEKLGFMPKVEVSMYFGRTEIQVTAVGKNFTGEKQDMLPVQFEASGIY